MSITAGFLAEHARVNTDGTLDVVGGYLTSAPAFINSAGDYAVNRVAVILTDPEPISTIATVTVCNTADDSRMTMYRSTFDSFRFLVLPVIFLATKPEGDLVVEITVGDDHIELPLRIYDGDTRGAKG